MLRRVEFLIIGFWSEKSGKGAVTYNMIATGLCMAMNYKKDIILIQAKYDYNRLDYAFIPFSDSNMMKEDYGYYNYGGIDSVLSRMENGIYTNRYFNNEIIRVKNSNLYFLPSTRKGGSELFNTRLYKILEKYIDELKKIDAIILIELCNGFEYVSKELLNSLDLLVVNISQDNKAIEDIRNNNMIMEKSVFVIGRYDDCSEFNLKNISRRYGIEEQYIGVIPYNVKFKDSVCQGRCKEFFDRHFNTWKEDDNCIFIKCVRSVVDIIKKRCVIE